MLAPIFNAQGQCLLGKIENHTARPLSQQELEFIIADYQDHIRWKKEMLQLEAQCDIQAIGKLLGMQLGTDIRPQIEPCIRSLLNLLAELNSALDDIHTTAHCISKAGPLSTPDLPAAWSKFDLIAVKATSALASAKGAGGLKPENCTRAEWGEIQSSAAHDAKYSAEDAARDNAAHAEALNRKANLVCPTCKSSRWSEIYPSKSDPSGFTLYCRKCEEGCVSPHVIVFKNPTICAENHRPD